MARTHGQQFASDTLPRAVHADPLALTRAIDAGEAPQFLAALWDEAGAHLVPIARVANTGFAATVERHGRYTIVIVTPPAPRGAGDAALIAIIGRGDGISRLSTIGYFVLELASDRGVPRFAIATGGGGERSARWSDGPLPDPRWFGASAFELYAGRTPQPITGIPELPFWYWWYAFEGAAALRLFNEARNEPDRFDAVLRAPILLLPEIADAAEIFIDAAPAGRLRELRPSLLRAPSLASAWQTIVHRLASSTVGSTEANTLRALPLIAEAGEGGALTEAQAYELEASVRGKLSALGIDSRENFELAEQLLAAARTPRGSGSIPPPFAADPLWAPLLLDAVDLPQHARVDVGEAATCDPSFVAQGGVRAGHAAWCADERSAMAHVVDSRWVFRTATAAAHFMRAARPLLADGLPAVATPRIGDDTFAFGDQLVSNRRTHVIVVRVGRVVARLQATEGIYAAGSREVLHAAALHPLAEKILQRARQGLAAYWLAIAYPTNAVPAFLHSKGYDAARLLEKHAILAHPELPSAMASLGEQCAPAAAALASFQAQVRAHRWSTYRQSMLALVRTLLDTEIGDPRVNAAHAHEIVAELRYLDPDPILLHLDAECRARN